MRGEGLKPEKTFLGLELTARRDVLLFLVVAAKAQEILERIRDAGRFEAEPGPEWHSSLPSRTLSASRRNCRP